MLTEIISIIKVTKNNIHIEDGWKVKSKKEKKEILLQLKEEHPECEVFKRKLGNLIREWTAHNRLYKLGIQKARTKDPDLDYPIKWYYLLAYNIIGVC